MTSIPALADLIPRALLFDGDAYREVNERPEAVCDGARLLLLLGAGLGLAGVLGATLTWATSPGLADMRWVLERAPDTLPLLRRLALGPWLAGLPYEWLWQAVGWLRPSPLLALARLLTAPLGLLLGWLIYGLLAYVLARLLGGRGRLDATLGCTALAEAPRVLLLLPLLPPLGPANVAVWAWVLAARFQALKAAHGLDGWRTFWAALLPAVFLAALVSYWLAVVVALALWWGV